MSGEINLNDLTSEELEVVKIFIDSIKRVRPKKEPKSFKFDWAGGLKGVFDKFSSVDLQHKSMEWR